MAAQAQQPGATGQKRIDSSDQDENASYEEIDDNDLKSMESDPAMAQAKAAEKGLARPEAEEEEEQYSEIEETAR